MNKSVSNDTFPGRYGDLKSIELNDSFVAMQFFIFKGHPSYNMGMFLDTLLIKNNTCLFKTEYDASCSIFFEFEENQVKVIQSASDLNMSCGFGHGVIADGIYLKTSNEIPIFDEDL